MNRLSGRIINIQVLGSIALVEVAVGRHQLTATIIGNGEQVSAWSLDMPVTLLFDETEVSLAKNLSGLISIRNRMPAIVTSIQHGQLLTRVVLDMDGHSFSSVITTKSSQALQLALGDAVEGLVKSNEMSVKVDRLA
jgi:molybdate transport system regulatory protein